MPHVYFLINAEGKYYIGSTVNLEKRLRHHFGGSTPSTKRMGDLRLVFSQQYDTLSEARLVETRLKKLKRKDYLEKIIQDGFIKLKPR